MRNSKRSRTKTSARGEGRRRSCGEAAMEALLELERVQRVLSLMSSRGLCDTGSSGGDAAADRFLAQFLLFMVQPSDSLTMERKILLVSELLGKATPDTLDEVQHFTRLEADQVISSGALLQPNKNFKTQAEKSTIQAAPMVGFDAMTRANSTLEDFLDASNEDSLGLNPDNSSSSEISIDDVMKAIHLKSFDYRVLNLLMYQLTGQQVNELHMDFLSISEFLVEISDDLYDYEDDVMNNTFNILRMFVVVYGSSEAPNMLAKCIGEAEEQYESFSKKLDPSLSGSYWRRCEEATKEGGKLSGHAYGTWNIPPVICDEELFRRERLS
nr:unnamed protein product [Digitaria exilis]